MRFSHAIAAVAAATSIGAAHATVVNISTGYNDPINGVQFADPSSPGTIDVGTTLHLGAGSYQVTPVNSSYSGAIFTAANRFSNVTLPAYGWEWNYWISVNGGAGTKVGFGENIFADDGDYQADAASAFALAPTRSFSLASASDVTFYWRDNVFQDNSGGVSFTVSAVPEPESMALAAAGLLALVVSRRRRRG